MERCGNSMNFFSDLRKYLEKSENGMDYRSLVLLEEQLSL